MGEWSKLVGERGEEIVSSFLNLVGHTVEKGITLDCVHNQKHQLAKESLRTTHGIDFLSSYKCFLQKDTLESLIISSKYTANGYKSNPKAEFKSFFIDLAQTIECYKKSVKRNQTQALFQGRGIACCNETGVLFYLSNDKQDVYKDIVSQLSDSNLPNDLIYDKLFVMDNYRVSFIFDSIEYAKKITSNIEFIYHDSGLVVNPSDTFNSGKLLPFQYFNSPVLPLRLETDNNEVILYIALNDFFSEGNLKRLMGLAQRLNNLTNKTILAFPDYDKLSHTQTVNKVLSVFNDNSFATKITIETYRVNFTNQL